MCDMTHFPDDQDLQVDHELSQIYAVTYTQSFMSHVTRSCVWYDSFFRWHRSESWSRTHTDICIHIHTCIYESCHTFICGTWLILQMIKVWKLIMNPHRYMHSHTHIHLWVISRIHTRDMTHFSHEKNLEVQISDLFTNSHSFLQIWKTRPTYMQKETSMQEKRDLHICKKQLVHIKKRDLHIWWEEIYKISKLSTTPHSKKRPIYMTKRDLYTWKRDQWIWRKETHIYDTKRSTRS
jgi:hypothetical protein